MDHVEIAAVAPRQAPETRHIVTPSTPPAPSGRLAVDGWTIQVVGDAVFITTDAGEVMTQTRTGQLNQKEIVVRRDPPSPANSRETETFR